MADIKTMLTALEKSRQEDDELMAQLIGALREHSDCLDEIADLSRYRSISRQVGASFIVEAAGILKDRRQHDQVPGIDELLFASVPTPAFHQ